MDLTIDTFIIHWLFIFKHSNFIFINLSFISPHSLSYLFIHLSYSISCKTFSPETIIAHNQRKHPRILEKKKPPASAAFVKGGGVNSRSRFGPVPALNYSQGVVNGAKMALWNSSGLHLYTQSGFRECCSSIKSHSTGTFAICPFSLQEGRFKVTGRFEILPRDTENSGNTNSRQHHDEWLSFLFLYVHRARDK